MAMVDISKVRLALRRRFLVTAGLPTAIQYDGQVLEGGLPSDALSVTEGLFPIDQRSISMGTSQALGTITYDVIAPMSRPDLIKSAYGLAHAILEQFENGVTFEDTDGVRVQIIRSETIGTGRRDGDESDHYFVPATVYWRSFSTLARR